MMRRILEQGVVSVCGVSALYLAGFAVNPARLYAQEPSSVPASSNYSLPLDDLNTVTTSSQRLNTEAELERLLQQRLAHPENAEAIDVAIHETFVERYAVLVLDSSGFSTLSQEVGIIPALADIERMRLVVVPLVEQRGGRVFKLEVDNVYAVFPSVELAVEVSHEIMVQVANIDKRVSIGIGFGDLIMISDGDRYSNVYGNEMNLASKLGEDVAQADEIMLSEAAFAALDEPAAQWESINLSVSGLTTGAYRWRSHRQD
ncbi:adenylate/guanylate cyclase domain-containing protein [Leptolyngbya sp. AN02str]|uniref:adenylate/guanylate cyclase domain-containing protein n=1 Tax=Leptolyngbya sp. AN02str TaxID=3423363 RepID=UPI003D3149A3